MFMTTVTGRDGRLQVDSIRLLYAVDEIAEYVAATTQRVRRTALREAFVFAAICNVLRVISKAISSLALVARCRPCWKQSASAVASGTLANCIDRERLGTAELECFADLIKAVFQGASSRQDPSKLQPASASHQKP